MDVVPEEPGAKLAKDKSFDSEPFRSTIIMILESNSGRNFCMSSVYDVLQEKFVENGTVEKLPGNEQTLRNYIHYLEDHDLIHRGPDHRYNSYEACQAIYRSFCRLGGRPQHLVIDQDAVFVASETYGEVIKTHTFEDFCTEQDLRLWVCNKADPESKGPIENSVGFVKKNFFSARGITCIDDVWRSLPGWLERKNKRIHRTTLRVPDTVFEEIEKEAFRPLLPSVYEKSPNTFQTYEVAALPYVLYRSCRYSVPQRFAFQSVRYKVVCGKLHIYDTELNYICSHNLSERKGSVNQLPEHRKQDSGDWIDIMERLRKKWNCYDFQHFINGIKKENPRHVSKQLRAVEQFLEAEDPDHALVAQVMKECCTDFRYQFSQFKAIYSLAKAGRDPGTREGRAEIPTGDVEYKDLSAYAKAFHDRVRTTEVTA